MRKKIVNIGLLFIFGLSLAVFGKNKDVDVYFNAGVDSYLRNDYYNAVKNFEKALELAPNDTKLQSLLEKVLFEAGRFYYLKQDYKQALYFLNKGEKLYPDNKKIKELVEIITSVADKDYMQGISQQKMGGRRPEKVKSYDEKSKESKPTQPKTEIAKSQPPSYHKKEYEEKTEYMDKLDFFVLVVDKLFSYYEREKSKHFLLIVAVAIICVFIVILVVSIILIVLQMNKMYSLLGEEQYNKIIKYVETNLDKLEKQIISTNNEFKHCVSKNNKFQLQVSSMAHKIEDLYRKIDVLSSYEEKKSKFNVCYLRELEKDITSITQKFPYEGKSEKISPEEATAVALKPTLVEKDEELNLLWRRTISAAVSLYKLNPESAMSKLAEMLDKGNAYSKASVIWALAEISTEETINFMLDLLYRYDNDYNVSSNIISALIYIANNKQLPEYLKEKIRNTLTKAKEDRGWIF